MRALATCALALLALAAGAAPAAATTTSTVPLAAEAWFYWLAPLFLLSFVGVLGLLAIGYYLKVLRPKLRGR